MCIRDRPIPTTQQNLILNKLPNETDSIISGLVDFQTEDFYTYKDSESDNYQIENKFKYNEKIYFKANKCEK